MKYDERLWTLLCCGCTNSHWEVVWQVQAFKSDLVHDILEVESSVDFVCVSWVLKLMILNVMSLLSYDV